MGLRFKDQHIGEVFFVTTSFRNRRNLGNIDGIYELLSESLNHRINVTGSKLIAYAFMPSHIHFVLIIGGSRLGAFVRDFKKFTAQKSIASLIGERQIWQQGYDRQAIWTEKILITKIHYIHANPVRSRLVDEPESWQYSSAADYAGRKNGPVNIWMDWYS